MSLRALSAIKPITHDSSGRQLTSSEKLVLLMLSDYYNDEYGCAWCGTARLATESLLSIRQLLRVIQSLEERSLISVERRPNKNNIYKFLFIPARHHCWYCGCDVFAGNREMDHQIPVSRGGKGGKNLVISCRTCNGRKGARTVEEYRLDFFSETHKFFGEGDNLSQSKSVDVTTEVTSKTEKASSMSPELLIEPKLTNNEIFKINDQIKTAERGAQQRFMEKFKQYRQRTDENPQNSS